MAAKKRSLSKASGRAAPAKGRAKKAPAAARHGKPAARKTGAASTKKPTRPVAARKSTGPVAKPAAAPKAPARHMPARPLAVRRSDSGPVTSSVGLIHGIPPYQPRAGEAYMSDRQLAHFRKILVAWKRELMEEVDRTVHHMQDEASNFPDPNDRATQESEFGLELRTRDRERKLLKKIDSALERIEDGSYGYCEETGEEIGLKRLEARPVATLSVEAQERRELAERQFRDREDGF
jgi:DnaK suppressor protein